MKNDSVKISVFKISNQYLYVFNRHKDDDEFLFRNNQKYLELKESKSFFKLQYQPYTTPFRHFKEFEGSIYFTYSECLGVLLDKKTLYYIDVGSTVLNYTKDKYNHLWVATLDNGLFEIDEHDSIIGHYLENVTVNDILVDHQSGIWASTSGKGLFHCASIKDIHHKSSESLGSKVTVIKKIKENLLIGTSKGDVFISDTINLNQIKIGKNDGLLDIQLNANKLIMTMNYKVEHLDFTRRSFRQKVDDKSEKYYKIFNKNSDTSIYLWRRGVNFFVNNEFQKRIDFNMKINIAELDQNIIWLGTEDGIYNYPAVFTKKGMRKMGILMPDKVNLQPKNYLKSTKKLIVTNIVIEKPGRVWFCTFGQGIYFYEKNKMNKYYDKNLPTKIVNSISFIKNGEVLLSTNKGLYLSKNFYSKSIETTWIRIHYGEVYNALEYNQKIYLSTSDGLVTIDLDAKLKFYNSVFLNLAKITIDSIPINPQKFNYVSSFRRKMEFKFDLITFFKDKPKLKYVLDGATSKAGFLNNYSYVLPILEPGKYRFVIYPEIQGGKTKLELTFEVLPALWQTWYFRVAAILLLVSIILILFTLILFQNRRNVAFDNRREKMLLEYKLIALKAQVNPHFISNCLAAIQSLILNNNMVGAAFYISQFGLMVRNILDFSSKPEIKLSDELEMLNLYIELEQLRFEHKFHFNVKIEDEINTKLINVPPLILNPIVENAIWHGLIPMLNKDNIGIDINIKRQNQKLKITVRDNGVGRSFEKKEKHNSKSYGTNITQQRLTNLNNLLETNICKIIYTDLKDSSGKPQGTEVIVYLPCK